MDTPQSEPSFWDRNRILIKGLLVGFLIIIMLIPGFFVASLVSERQSRQSEVMTEVSSKWAFAQTVTGPMLMVPYHDVEVSADGKTRIAVIHTACLLPDVLRINGTMQPTIKKRSLYSVTLYNSTLKLQGTFSSAGMDALKIPAENILWQDARLVANVDDMRGITDQVALQWNDTNLYMEAGVPDNKQVKDGISAPVALSPNGQYNFTINLNLRGSEYLNFIPMGKLTEVTLSAPWSAPSFDGQYLPDTSSITPGNFTAHWKIPSLSHNYPQQWKDNEQDLQRAAFGVKLIQPVDGYSKTNRSVKYAILFIALTFTFFFFLEILLRRRIHAVQYLLVGMALTIFYTLLLSISEYTGFNTAYLIASLATVSLITMYVWSIFKAGRTTIGFSLSLAGLYGYIFILIQSEDYALLFGSIGLFLILAVIMYYSRKIDWYATGKHKEG